MTGWLWFLIGWITGVLTVSTVCGSAALYVKHNPQKIMSYFMSRAMKISK